MVREKDYEELLHPELQPGEVWVGNTYPRHYERDWSDFKTRRAGVEPYDRYRRRLPKVNGLFPVFVQRSELEERSAYPRTKGRAA